MPAHRGLRAALLAAAIAGACAAPAFAQPPMAPGVWMPDQGNGTYANPILAGDYSDPDVVRVGEDYYLTASSFANVPGLPVLHSRDLVNWTLVGHALTCHAAAAVYGRRRSAITTACSASSGAIRISASIP